ncbi:DUF1754-domain-containing protein [Martensiomyces pterosporus]|nr:DUF1754-domain-containing protein [Martensiomyces pterosporus]
MGDEYDYGVVHGSLKLKKNNRLFKKSTHKDGGKRKKKSSKPKKDEKEEARTEAERTEAERTEAQRTEVVRTEAEKKYDDVRMKRRLERIEKFAEKSYRDRVKDFNEKLERAPEHHEMPKVGPG